PAEGQGTAFCDATLGAIRSDITNCCSPAEANALTADLYKNIGSYVTKCEQTLERSISLHRTAPVPQNYSACINGFNAVFGGDAGACSGLDQFRPIDVLSPACAQAFLGKGAVDDPCAGDFDCASGVCIGYTDTADGKCQEPAPQNGTCGLGGGSATPAADLLITPINSCSSGLYCLSGNCQTLISLPDAGCTTDPSCEQGLCLDEHCNQPAPPGPRFGSGAYCHTSEDCNTGLFCDQSQAATFPNDGGVTPGATGLCEASKASSDTCAGVNACVDHECLGRCDGAHCQPLCTFP
ncbi:MAG: hypothetical protein ACREJX_03220, partial [Polyangiaceae bacterium]